MKSHRISSKRLGIVSAIALGLLGILSGFVAYAEEERAPKPISTEVCQAHGAPVDVCFICDPSLREKGRLWCKEHDRYENRCFLCHPDIEDKDREWCKEHHLYEDECVLCRPALSENNSGIEEPDVCQAHGAPVDVCFICDPSLREKGRLWCKEHDRYENRCFLCHPDIEDKDREWCKEHHLYEDECVLCRPSGKGTSKATDEPVLFCTEHGVDEHECGICHPELIHALDPGEGMKIRFASDTATRKAGVKTSVAGQSTVSDRIEVFAEVMFDQNKLAHIALPVDGILQKINADLGDKVSADDVLATVTSVEISKAIGEYRRAIALDRLREQTIDRERTLRKENISSERDLQEAIAAHQAADAEVLQTRHQLLALGLSSSQVSELEKDKTTSTALEVRAPFDGEVVARAAVQGALVETGTPLFKIVDRSKMWAMLKVPAGKIDQVRLGQRVEIRLDADPGQIFEGRVTWISAEIDENTRMAKVRAEISNPEKRLRSGVFARGSIILSVTEDAVVVPQSSLQQVDDQHLAFVKLEDDLYEARPVTLGAKQGNHRQILGGLIPGETIVVGNSFVMKSQLLLSRLGAGCVDD